MKFFLFYIFIFANAYNISAQIQHVIADRVVCLPNGDFDDYCGTDYYWCTQVGWNLSFYNANNISCVPNWQRSHGTPNILNEDPNLDPENNFIHLWYNHQWSLLTNVGEGIYYNYPFYQGQSYTIKVRLRIINQNNIGSVRFVAANGLTTPSTMCTTLGGGYPGEPIPTPTSEQEIQNETRGLNQGWKEYTYSFAPLQNYSQLWIYPVRPNTSVYDIVGDIDYVDVCSDLCYTDIIFNSGTIPAGNNTFRNIDCGSSAGTGGIPTVVNNSALQTSLIASSQVHFVPEYHASATGTGYLHALIQSCNIQEIIVRASGSLKSNPAFDLAKNHKSQNSIKMSDEKTSIILYPNPAGTNINIELTSQYPDEVLIILSSLSGASKREIKHVVQSKGRVRIPLQIGGLAKGLWIVEVQTQKEKFYSKFIKS